MRGSLTYIHDDVNYYPHQLEGIRELANRPNFLLADEMGLGKSLQALTVAAIDFERGRAKRVIVVAPASLKWNWANELEAFTSFKGYVLNGTPSQRRKQLEQFAIDGHVLIVNYEQVASHLEDFNALDFDIAIFDEAHYLKGRKSKRTKACHALQRKRTFMITGSPLLNHVDDLWSLLHMIEPKEYPKFWAFVNRYAVFGGYQGKSIIGVKNQVELSTRVSSVMLRRTKSEVLDLPEKQYVNLIVDLSAEQKKLYDQAVDELQITVPNQPSAMEIENALTKMLRLKQICGTTATIIEGHDHSTKLDLAVERIAEIVENGHRIVVFTQFRKVLECLVNRCNAAGVPTWQLHGGVKATDRFGVVQDWSESEPGAMCAMLQVAGVGLNMTAAGHALFLDKLWVPKLNEQAEDRIHRIGADATQPVQILSISCRGTVEQRVDAILRRKEKVFGAIVQEDDWKRNLIQAFFEEED